MCSIETTIKRKCSSCKKVLETPFEKKEGFLQTNDGRAWHVDCLVCSWCQCPLYDETNPSGSKCYTRGGRNYCPRDYFRFSPLLCEFKLPPKCMTCQQPIRSGDKVIHSPFHTFHAGCFACDVCGKGLLPGQPYTLLDGYPICLEDSARITRAEEVNECLQFPQSFGRRKRIRTSFNEQQQLSMQNFFAQNQNPNTNDLMSLSEETGLAKRVLQVWFQNARAKMRRITGGLEKSSTA